MFKRKKTNTSDINQFPTIIMDKEDVHLKGMSLMENPKAYYKDLTSKIIDAFKGKEKLNLHFNIKYMNTLSTKLVYNLIVDVNDKVPTNVLWYYDKRDDITKENGEEFEELLDNISFNLCEQ